MAVAFWPLCLFASTLYPPLPPPHSPYSRQAPGASQSRVHPVLSPLLRPGRGTRPHCLTCHDQDQVGAWDQAGSGRGRGPSLEMRARGAAQQPRIMISGAHWICTCAHAMMRFRKSFSTLPKRSSLCPSSAIRTRSYWTSGQVGEVCAASSDSQLAFNMIMCVIVSSNMFKFFSFSARVVCISMYPENSIHCSREETFNRIGPPEWIRERGTCH